MLTDSFRNIFHVEIYALIGFIIFFTFFIYISLQVMKMNKEEVTTFSRLPFDDSDSEVSMNDDKERNS